jgi:NADH dehydrogenase
MREARGGVLVIGGGFAGGYVARLLGRRGATIVNPENFMLYTPMLPEAASGTLEPRHTVVPLRQMCPHAELVLGRVTEIDEEARSAQVETPDAGAFEIHYDQLVLALGAVPRTFPVPGLAEHGLGFKDLADAIHLRNRVLRELEAADAELASGDVAAHLGFVFVGAGYAGVEALAELADLSHDALRWYPRLRGAPQRWVLVDAAPKILAEIPSRLGDYAAHTLVWTAGVKASPTLDQFGMPLDERGRVTVDPYLRVSGRERVWALGDCAAVPNQATPGRLDPPTCQHALRQARRLAGNLSGDVAPYRYRMLGQVATLGRYKGIADVLGIKLRGFPGWFVTRSYHLFQLPLVSRKLRVVVDWTTSLFFRRDIAELSGLGAPPRRVTSPGRLRRGRHSRWTPTGATSGPPRATASSSARRRTGRPLARRARARRPS